MYPERLPNGKLRLVGRYKDPYTNKIRRTSVPLASESPQAINKASRLLNEKITELQNQKSGTDIPFSQLVREWKESHSTTVKPRTMRVYKRPLEIISGYIADDVIVRNIDVRLIQKLMDELRNKYADNTVNLIKQPLNMILKYAVNHDYLDNNPLKKVTSPRRTSNGPKKSDFAFYESKNITRIIDEMRLHTDSSHIANFAETLFLTGMRPGELLALQWNKVDFDNKTITIEYTLDYTTNGHANATLSSTKNDGSYRTIDAPNRVLDMFIEEHNYQQLHNLKSDFIFVSKKGKHLSINTIDRRMKNVSNKLFDVSITAHKYRHAHITLLAEMGIPLKAIMQRVGHVDSQTTIKIYTHVTDKIGNQLMQKLNDFAPQLPQPTNK